MKYISLTNKPYLSLSKDHHSAQKQVKLGFSLKSKTLEKMKNFFLKQNLLRLKPKLKSKPRKKIRWNVKANKWKFLFANSLFTVRGRFYRKDFFFFDNDFPRNENFFFFLPVASAILKKNKSKYNPHLIFFLKFNHILENNCVRNPLTLEYFQILDTRLTELFYLLFFKLNSNFSMITSRFSIFCNNFFLRQNKNYSFRYFFSLKKGNKKLTYRKKKQFKHKNLFLTSFKTFELIYSFYKKKRYGFFLLNNTNKFSELVFKVNRFSSNFDKFDILRGPLLLKNKKNFFLNLQNLLFFFPQNNSPLHYNKKMIKYELYTANSDIFSSYASYLNYRTDYKFLSKKTNKDYYFSLFLNNDVSNRTNKINFLFKNSNFCKKNNSTLLNKIVFFTNFELFSNFLTSPFYSKLFLLKFTSVKQNNVYDVFNFFFNNFFFYSKLKNNNLVSNLVPLQSVFIYAYRKFLIKSFNYKKLSSTELPFHYFSLVKFLEFCSGKKISLKFNPFMSGMLTFEEQTRCLLWSQKIKSFRKVLGPRLFLNESLQIIYLCLKNKDLHVLSSWMLQMFYKISFWKYKLFFRYLQYILRYFFWTVFLPLRITGLKFQMKGKVSVAGNARTRTVLNKIGIAGHSTYKNKILYDLKLINTFTGVIGFKTWMFFI